MNAIKPNEKAIFEDIVNNRSSTFYDGETRN